MKHSNHRAALLTAALLCLPPIAAASPPPDATARVAVCNSGYFAEMSLDFGNTGTTAIVVAKANLVSTPVGPFPPPPPYFNVYASASHRPDANSAWSSNDQQSDGYGAYPAQPARAQKSAFRSPTCELAGSAVVSVHCPSGQWEYKTLDRVWVGCGL